ncbi:hypothetical protein Slala02_11830 [Streptomyces lavendulae subsp. lavendulae]|nr:hypothetical protein Slala02_11830 [Streptomyces lavendulae subsp. lavendulae]
MAATAAVEGAAGAAVAADLRSVRKDRRAGSRPGTPARVLPRPGRRLGPGRAAPGAGVPLRGAGPLPALPPFPGAPPLTPVLKRRTG